MPKYNSVAKALGAAALVTVCWMPVAWAQKLPPLEQSPKLELRKLPTARELRTDDDIRRQKEEASESLNKTLKEIDERSRTRAIESGKGVIIQQ